MLHEDEALEVALEVAVVEAAEDIVVAGVAVEVVTGAMIEVVVGAEVEIVAKAFFCLLITSTTSESRACYRACNAAGAFWSTSPPYLRAANLTVQ